MTKMQLYQCHRRQSQVRTRTAGSAARHGSELYEALHKPASRIRLSATCSLISPQLDMHTHWQTAYTLPVYTSFSGPVYSWEYGNPKRQATSCRDYCVVSRTHPLSAGRWPSSPLSRPTRHFRRFNFHPPRMCVPENPEIRSGRVILIPPIC